MRLRLCEVIVVNPMKIRNYSELIKLKTFEDRYEYLRLPEKIGSETFGGKRYLNQSFYTSSEWRQIRDSIIVRDNGMDLGMPGYSIFGRIYIHHMNPIVPSDIVNNTEYLVNPEYLICVSYNTHEAIHFGDANLLPQDPVLRKPGDTCLWK